MNTAAASRGSGRMGRPPKNPEERKVPKSVYLQQETLARLALIDSNLSKAIEKLASQQASTAILEKD